MKTLIPFTNWVFSSQKKEIIKKTFVSLKSSTVMEKSSTVKEKQCPAECWENVV